MEERDRHPAGEGRRLTKYTQLSKDLRTVVVDPLAGQPIVIIEREHTA